jgi:NAD(P)-dependent dehydrogenase (short-subunit alcohol dehydrogenase family)
MDSFANRVVLITGTGSGIGRQLALVLAAEGATIAALDRRPEGLAALSAELAGKRIATASGDVTDRASLYPAVAELERQLGPTDVLFANAGVGLETAADPYNAEAIELQIRVNLIGVSNSIGAVLPGMLTRKSGHLVAISSLASYRGLPKMAGYCASKAGVNSLLEALRIEVEPQGIATTTICPGWIRTPLTKNIDVPQPYLMELDYAARQIVEAVRRKRKFFAFPGASARRVGLMRLLPTGMSDWIVRRMIAMYGMKKAKTDGAGPG